MRIEEYGMVAARVFKNAGVTVSGNEVVASIRFSIYDNHNFTIAEKDDDFLPGWGDKKDFEFLLQNSSEFFIKYDFVEGFSKFSFGFRIKKVERSGFLSVVEQPDFREIQKKKEEREQRLLEEYREVARKRVEDGLVDIYYPSLDFNPDDEFSVSKEMRKLSSWLESQRKPATNLDFVKYRRWSRVKIVSSVFGKEWECKPHNPTPETESGYGSMIFNICGKTKNGYMFSVKNENIAVFIDAVQASDFASIEIEAESGMWYVEFTIGINDIYTE